LILRKQGVKKLTSLGNSDRVSASIGIQISRDVIEGAALDMCPLGRATVVVNRDAMVSDDGSNRRNGKEYEGCELHDYLKRGK